MLKNTMGITNIVYEDRLLCFCPLGKSDYHNNLRIEFIPNENIPDYIVLNESIQNMHLQVLTIEDAVASVVEIMKKYDPFFIRVESFVDDANHPTVTVTKEYHRH